jgi:hypothetical protein
MTALNPVSLAANNSRASPAPSQARAKRDDDARSVYSVAGDDDDTMSVISASSRGTTAMREREEGASMGSHLETLVDQSINLSLSLRSLF